MTRHRKARAGRRVCWAFVPVTAVAAGAQLVLTAGVAKADSVVFDAFAQGIGVQATLTNRSLPLGLVFEGIGPEASSRVSSFGQSDAEASFPYTGTVVPGLFGLGPPLLLGLPGIEYPTQAATGAGQAPQDVDFPGISLHAESGTATNVAEAVLGGGGDGFGGGRSTSRVDRNEAGDVLSTATAQFTTLKLGGSLVLSNLRSTVAVKADSATGALTRSSSFSIGRLTAPGLSLTVPKESPSKLSLPNPLPGLPQAPPVALPPIPLAMGGQTIPAPDLGFVDGTFTTTLPGFGNQKFAVPAQSVLDGFKSAGLDMAYQPAVETPYGMQGGSFTVKYTFDKLPDNQYFSGPVPVTYNVGSAVASVNLSVPKASVATGEVSSGLPPAPAVPPAGVVPGSGPGPEAPGFVAPVDTAPTDGAPPTVTLTPAAPEPNSRIAQAGSTSSLPLNSNLSNLYFLMILLAIGQLVAITVLRMVGVRR